MTMIITRLESTNDIANTKNYWIIGTMDDYTGLSIAKHPAVHFRQESARKEADRLARNHPGTHFLILQISGASVANYITHI
jgi:hypothetical protein